MKYYTIPQQTIPLSPKTKAILEIIGVKFSELPKPQKIKPILMKDINFEKTRTISVLKVVLGNFTCSLDRITARHFVECVTVQDLLRYRNCGKGTIEDIKNGLALHGYELIDNKYFKHSLKLK